MRICIINALLSATCNKPTIYNSWHINIYIYIDITLFICYVLYESFLNIQRQVK